MLRLAALYGVSNSGAGWQQCYSALLACLETRFGKGRVWQRSTRYYEPSDVAEEVCVAIILGLRDEGAQYLAHCLRAGIPTIVVDMGWMRREHGYWQFSVGGLNVAPLKAPSSDRFDHLQLKVFDSITKKHYHTLLVGQVPGDAQHDMSTETDVVRWAKAAADEAFRLFPKRRIYWRPHPGFPIRIGKPTITTNPERYIQEFIREEMVGSAIVCNSTLGLDLLRNGVHVVAQGPRTVYTDLTSPDIANLETCHPGPDRVHELLVRLAYGQYQLSELNWSMIERVFDLHGVTGDW